MKPVLLTIAVLFAACGSTTPAKPLRTEPATEEAKAIAEQQAHDAKRRDMQQVLIDLNQSMASYSALVNQRGASSADRKAEKLRSMIQQQVMGQRTDVWHADEKGCFESLKAIAADASQPENQGIALAALGFAEGPEVMPIILQGAQLQNPDTIDRAVFGLAILADPRTPPGVLVRIIDDEKHPEAGRMQAAWTLLRVQEGNERKAEIVAFWQKTLRRPMHEMPAGVLVQALRGLGLTRDQTQAELAAPFATHPAPLVRMAAAVALGRLNAQKHYEVLLAMISPTETNSNVRLAALKALQALAGGQDRGYDVEAWRDLFKRG